MADEERSPLLSEKLDGADGFPPGGYPGSRASFPGSVDPGEPPPPYSPHGSPDSGSAAVVSCRVCQSTISVEGKMHQHVVKCNICNEATPIKTAPVGKKYVRCPCDCLLICKVTSQKIACPRPYCKRIITLGPVHIGGGSSPEPQRRPLGLGVMCGHCTMDRDLRPDLGPMSTLPKSLFSRSVLPEEEELVVLCVVCHLCCFNRRPFGRHLETRPDLEGDLRVVGRADPARPVCFG